MLLGLDWLCDCEKAHSSSSKNKIKADHGIRHPNRAASYAPNQICLALQHSEYLFSLVCLSFFFLSLLSLAKRKHFDSFSHTIPSHPIPSYRSFVRAFLSACSLVFSFCTEAALESAASFRILVYSNNFLISACHPRRVIVPIFLLPSRTLTTLHAHDDNVVASGFFFR